MKRSMVALVALAVIGFGGCTVVRAGSDDIHSPPAVFAAAAVTTNVMSTAIDMKTYKPAGYFSLQVEVSGTGTVRYVECEARNSTSGQWIPVYLQCANSVYTNRIFESWATNSGANADGTGLVGFGPPIARYYRLKVYATNGIVTVNGWLAIQ